VATTQATLGIGGSVLANCGAQQSPATGGGLGGAVSGSLIALDVAGSLVLASAASGADGLGGGLFLQE
jgi:hypothetical protein